MKLLEKKIDKEFSTCDKCGYKKGFHVSLIKQETTYEIILICPNCSQKYKINWTTNLN